MRTPVHRAAERGVEALAAGDHERASKRFTEALSLDPQNPKLHLLNGLAHHAGYLAGARARGPLAETAYRVAVTQNPGSWRAAYHLGLLYLDMRHYAAAQATLAEAARLVSDEPDVYHALAVASYYQRDPLPALWASRRAVELGPNRAQYIHAAAVSAGAAGLSDEAAQRLSEYRAAESDAARVRQLERRLDGWRRVHARLAEEHDMPRLAQAAPPVAPPIPGAEPATTPPPPMPPGGPPPMPPGVPPPLRTPVAANWSDCVQATTPPTTMAVAPTINAVGPGGSADETTALPALPSPCVGLPLPRMALIDVTLVRTEETRATGQGVNLLESLQVVLGGVAGRQQSETRERRADGSRTTTSTRTNTLSGTISVLPTQAQVAAGAIAGIAYSLDIARASDTRVEVIARPTLVALDRTPSNFFSGSNVTVALTGQFGGNLQEKPVGVSLSVTPTFIDDDTMLLSVKATRSFFEPTTRGTFAEALATTRNTVTANAMIKYGQTLILSGMVERDLQDDDSGVPLLRDLPGIQYLFSRRTTQDFRKEVVAILTPRRATFLPEALQSVEDYLTRPDLTPGGRHDVDHMRAQARRAVTAMTPHATAIIAALSDNLFYHEFRTGDLAPPRRHGGPEFRRILKEILELVYY